MKMKASLMAVHEKYIQKHARKLSDVNAPQHTYIITQETTRHTVTYTVVLI